MYLPSEKGIYFVFVGKVIDDPIFKMPELRLLYIGEAKDICDRHNYDDGTPKHEHYLDFYKACKEGEQIAYAYALLPGIEYTRKLIESALIYQFQPPINVSSTYTFNHRKTILQIDSEPNMEFPLNGIFTVEGI